jgi:hypothetical protein
MTKERTLNELRQEKEYGYKVPVTKVNYYYQNNINLDSQYIIELIELYPNDQDLGKQIRKYFLELKND